MLVNTILPAVFVCVCVCVLLFESAYLNFIFKHFFSLLCHSATSCLFLSLPISFCFFTKKKSSDAMVTAQALPAPPASDGTRSPSRYFILFYVLFFFSIFLSFYEKTKLQIFFSSFGSFYSVCPRHLSNLFHLIWYREKTSKNIFTVAWPFLRSNRVIFGYERSPSFAPVINYSWGTNRKKIPILDFSDSISWNSLAARLIIQEPWQQHKVNNNIKIQNSFFFLLLWALIDKRCGQTIFFFLPWTKKTKNKLVALFFFRLPLDSSMS